MTGLSAAVPELVVARRYTGPATAESSFLAANPELMVARRHWSLWPKDMAALSAEGGQ